MSRPTRLVAVLAVAGAALLTACGSSSGPSGAGAPSPAATASGPAADATAFPLTVEHAFGTTTLDTLPERVATVSWVNADVALALGVVPVGMPSDEFGGNDQASTPWKDARLAELGAAIGTDGAPAQYSEADGPAYDDIARTSPDVILAAYSGLTREQYDKLSAIAPVVAYPELAYGTPWQESTRLIGTVLGRSAQADRLVTDTERLVTERAADYPQLAGTTFVYTNLVPGAADGISVYTASDNRPRFLSMLGMKQADVVTRASTGDAFFVPWSPERADELDGDVVVSWVADDTVTAAIAADPLLRRIPAVARGSLVTDSDPTLVLAISASSPLSLPWALDAVLPPLAAAADAARATS